MTRFKTYQTDYGFITIDETKDVPTDFIAGPFDVTTTEADMIEQGPTIEVNGSDVNVYHKVEVL